MPRLPTILVIGSQDMSTSLPASGVTRSRVAMSALPSLVSPAGLVARGELRAAVSPDRLLDDRRVRDAAQPAHHGAVDRRDARGDTAAGRCVHEGHELVGE